MARELATQESLKGEGCVDPNCKDSTHTQLVLVSNCHPDCGTEAAYDKADGVLTVRCGHCHQTLVEFLIAPSLLQ